MNNEEDLDGCSIDFDNEFNSTTAEELLALTLFADINFLDEKAVTKRIEEWGELECMTHLLQTDFA